MWRRAGPGTLGRTRGIQAQGRCQGARRQSIGNVSESRDRIYITFLFLSCWEALLCPCRQSSAGPGAGASGCLCCHPAAVLGTPVLPLAQSRPAAFDLLCALGRGLLALGSGTAPSPGPCLPLAGSAPARALSGTVPVSPRPRKRGGVSLALEENPREQVPQVPGTCCDLHLLPLPYERSANVVGTGQGFLNTPCPEASGGSVGALAAFTAPAGCRRAPHPAGHRARSALGL